MIYHLVALVTLAVLFFEQYLLLMSLVTPSFSHRISYNFVQRQNSNMLNAINAELQQLAPQRQMLPNATF
jgi:hypothetical protein